VRRLLLLALLPILGQLAGCGPKEIPPAERAAIEKVLSTYADRMAEAYRDGDSKTLEGIATEREKVRVQRAISELAAQGRGLRPTLKSLVVETVEPAGHTSVEVGTLEVWDLTVVALGSESEVSQSLAQENHLSYSLVRENGHWLVLSRALRSTQAPS